MMHSIVNGHGLGINTDPPPTDLCMWLSKDCPPPEPVGVIRRVLDGD